MWRKTVMEMDNCDSYMTLWIYLMLMNCTLKTTKMINAMYTLLQ
jgi:hypothetical protein